MFLIATLSIDKESSMASGGRRKSSILVDRKLSVDFARKLSAISVASDVSLISDRFGLDQGELKNIVQDILEMNVNDDFDVSHEIIKVSRHDVTLLQLGSEDGMSEYGDTEEPGLSIWQELQNETIRLDSRKSSSSSQVAMSCQWQIKKMLNISRPALTLWTLLKISSQLRSTWERYERCWLCTSTNAKSPTLSLQTSTEQAFTLFLLSIYL